MILMIFLCLLLSLLNIQNSKMKNTPNENYRLIIGGGRQRFAATNRAEDKKRETLERERGQQCYEYRATVKCRRKRPRTMGIDWMESRE
jgi:hypothetical protein